MFLPRFPVIAPFGSPGSEGYGLNRRRSIGNSPIMMAAFGEDESLREGALAGAP